MLDKQKIPMDPLGFKKDRIDSYNFITRDAIVKDKALREEVEGIIQRRYSDGATNASQKRSFFQTLYKRLTDPSDSDKNMIMIYTMLRDMKAFLAAYSDSDSYVDFSDNMSVDEELSYMLEIAAKFDAGKMNKGLKDMANGLNSLMYGTGVRIKTGFDKTTMTPTYEVIHPGSWMPDPQGNVLDGDYRYHFIERSSSKQALLNENKSSPNKYFNLDEITEGSFLLSE